MAAKRTNVTTLRELPLFADERMLSEAILGHGAYTHWRAIAPLLERRGFPKVDGLTGGRYTPAVKAFFDSEYSIGGATQAQAPHRPAELGAWKKRRGNRKQTTEPHWSTLECGTPEFEEAARKSLGERPVMLQGANDGR
jgi:hypothetical protein